MPLLEWHLTIQRVTCPVSRHDISDSGCPSDAFRVTKGDLVLVRCGKKLTSSTPVQSRAVNIDVRAHHPTKESKKLKVLIQPQKDAGTVPMMNINCDEAVIQVPKTIRGTRRLQSRFKFDIEVPAYNVR